MFQQLSQNLTKVFDKLRGRGVLSEEDVNLAMREVRIALLEGDVALPVVKAFIEQVKTRAVGAEVLQSVSPSQMVIKIVHDELTAMLGSEHEGLNLVTEPPAVVMMTGLQGSGKTTSSAKLASYLKNTLHKRVLLASLDVARPAAQEQLAVLAKQVDVISVPIVPGETPVAITKRTLQMGRLEGYDVIILDTAGRLHIDQALMEELIEIKKLANPIETLLVADAMTGQDAVTIAKSFHEQLTITGIVLTRVDGDARGGAALSMRHVTGCPIKFLGLGEKLADLQLFHPERIASRILDMGDIVSLVEKAASTIDKEEADKLSRKVQKGQFDLEDLSAQLRGITKMGGLQSMLSMLPGLGKLQDKIPGGALDEKIVGRQLAIISSMTLKERRNPKLLNASRKRRIANGAGVQVQDVNRLLKQHQEMSMMVKKFSKMDKKSLMRSGLGKLFS